MGSSFSKAAGATSKWVSPKTPSVRKGPSINLTASHTPEDFVIPRETGGGDSTPQEFSARLHKMGIVSPQNVVSTVEIRYPALATNPTLTALEARNRLQKRVDEQFNGNAFKAGFVDITMARRMVELRESGHSPQEIEKTLHLTPGMTEKLGKIGILSSV